MTSFIPAYADRFIRLYAIVAAGIFILFGLADLPPKNWAIQKESLFS